MAIKVSLPVLKKRTFHVPSSKPETQRAIMASALARGTSYIYNDLRCLETTSMKRALSSIGVVFREEAGRLVVIGNGGKFRTEGRVISAEGSGLVFRFMAALTSFSSGPSVVTGDKRLCERVMAPLFEQIRALGGDIETICSSGCAPVVNWGKPLIGGTCEFDGNISSQFITAVALVAPLAAAPTSIKVKGEILSRSYITQTLRCMESAGIGLSYDESYANITVRPGAYESRDYTITGDYTSASYIIAFAALFEGTTVLENMSVDSLQGEKAILSIVESLGVHYEYRPESGQLVIHNEGLRRGERFEFDVSDCPNIVPTLAALGAFVEGTFCVRGASITRFHKAPRVRAMVHELRKLGVDIIEVEKDGVCDGFEIRGASGYRGGVRLSDWSDHRIFMSLFLASLRCSEGNYLEGRMDVSCSYPSFLDDFSSVGARLSQFNHVGAL